MADYTLIVESVPQAQVVLAAQQGPSGAPGSGTTDPDALHVSQRLAEFADPASKAAARANLELETIDGGTFF